MSLQNTNRPTKSTSPCWRLLAIGLDPDKTAPDLYGAIHEDETQTDVPLMADDRIVFFTAAERAPELIQKYGGPWAHDTMDIVKPTLWCDAAQALHYLSAGGIDTSASVVEAINVLLDLVKASGAKMVDSRRLALHSIADYCTTSKDLTRYLQEVGDHSGRELVDAMLWCIGAVVAKAKIL